MSKISTLLSKLESAEQIKKKYGLTVVKDSTGLNEKTGTWYGWSHRAICGFKIGDKLFDENWTPDGSKPSLDNPATNNLPFTKRGSKTIKTLKEAEQAAIAFSNYVS